MQSLDPSKNIKNYKRSFKKLDRSLKMINEFSEFLKLLDLREIGILRIMMLRFMIEAVEANIGRLIEVEDNSLRVTEVFSYKGGKISSKKVFRQKKTIDKNGYDAIAEVIKKEFPIIVESHDANWINQKNNYSYSIIRVPVIVNNKVRYVAELIRKISLRSKPFTEEELSVITVISNIASAVFTNAELFNDAIHDKLTGLYNIHYFKNLMSNEIQKVLKFKTKFSLAIIDLDYFKHINDTYGHNVGDEALKFFSKILIDELRRSSDIIARYGGDEFIAAFPSTDAEGAHIVCEKVRKRLNKEPLVLNDVTSIPITPSIGIAEIQKEDIENTSSQEEIFKKLFLKADTALYNSKRTGKNRITIYTPELPLIEEREL